MTLIYYVGLFLCSVATTFSQYKYGKSLRSNNDILIYIMITGVMSMLFFGGASCFCIVLNSRIIFYSVILTAISIISYYTQLFVYKYMGVAEVSFITTGGKLLFTSIAGIVIFSEKVSLLSVIRISLMLLAVLFLFIEKSKIEIRNKKSESERSKSTFSLGILICVLIIIIGTASTVVSKYIAIDTQVVSSESVFFFTNLMITAFSVVFLLFESRFRVKKVINAFKTVSAKQYLNVTLKTIAGSLSLIIGILILSEGDVSFYVPLSNALGLIATQAVAFIILREKPLILPSIAAILSLIVAFWG